MNLFKYYPSVVLIVPGTRAKLSLAVNGKTWPAPVIWERSQEEKGDAAAVPLLLTLVCFLLLLPPVPTGALIICTNICSTFFRFVAGTKKASQNKVMLLCF